jgi:hypothetical protein
MGELAITWYPLPSPFGVASLTAAVVVALFIAIVWGLAKSCPRLSNRLEWVAPLVLLGISAVSPVEALYRLPGFPRFLWGYPPPWLSCPEYVAGIIYMGAGFGFALSNLRKPSVLQRLNGVAFTFVFGSLMVAEAANWLDELFSYPMWGFNWDWSFRYVVAFWVLWIPAVVAIWRSASKRGERA